MQQDRMHAAARIQQIAGDVNNRLAWLLVGCDICDGDRPGDGSTRAQLQHGQQQLYPYAPCASPEITSLHLKL